MCRTKKFHVKFYCFSCIVLAARKVEQKENVSPISINPFASVSKGSTSKEKHNLEIPTTPKRGNPSFNISHTDTGLKQKNVQTDGRNGVKGNKIQLIPTY